MDLKHAESYYIRILLQKVKLGEVMAQNPRAIRFDEPFSRVEEKFRQYHIRHLPVVDNQEKLVGLITQRDLYRVHPPRKDEDGNWYYDKESLDSHILKHVMTQNVLTLSPDNSVAEAVLIMVDKKYGCIPIVEKDGILCGIVTQIDLLRVAAQIIREK